MIVLVKIIYCNMIIRGGWVFMMQTPGSVFPFITIKVKGSAFADPCYLLTH